MKHGSMTRHLTHPSGIVPDHFHGIILVGADPCVCPDAKGANGDEGAHMGAPLQIGYSISIDAQDPAFRQSSGGADVERRCKTRDDKKKDRTAIKIDLGPLRHMPRNPGPPPLLLIPVLALLWSACFFEMRLRDKNFSSLRKNSSLPVVRYDSGYPWHACVLFYRTCYVNYKREMSLYSLYSKPGITQKMKGQTT
jgi:hypothetical protein